MEINHSTIRSNYELRAFARNQLKGNWGTAILLCLIYGLIMGAISGSFSIITYFIHPAARSVGSLIGNAVTGPLILGLACCFVKLVRKEDFRFENLFDGFKNFNSAFVLQLLIVIFTFLWTLLFIIPGIIASYRYAMAFYILNDNPQLSASEALTKSKEMMRGYKWKLFCLHFSFIGWAILSIFTLFIGLLWLVPYINASIANFYENLKQSAEQSFPNV